MPFSLTLDKTTIWSYDISGNICTRTEYACTTGAVGTATATFAYSYANGWKDQLTSFGGQNIVYDQAGNPTSYKGATLSWTRGRLLSGYNSVSMSYDSNGVRRTKVVLSGNGSTTTTYCYNGNNLVRETKSGANSSTRTYLYNSQGVIGFVYNGATYTYRKNLFGDIVSIYSGTSKLAEYAYDAWGNCTVVSDVGNIGAYNPFRYRGYYWDNDLGLYYLMSRYYDPQTGRFINADSLEYLDPETIGGLNLYTYCGNNPVMHADPSGHVAILTLLIGALIGVAASFASSVFFQSITGDKEINWGQVALDTIIGGISGALGASGMTKIVSIISGGILGIVGSVGGDLIASNGDWSKVNIGKAVLMGTIGAVAGHFTGAGPKIQKP